MELRKLLPDVNDLQAQEVLVRAHWVVEKARKTLVDGGHNSSNTSHSEQDRSLNSSGEIFDTVEDYKKSKSEKATLTTTKTKAITENGHLHRPSSSSSSTTTSNSRPAHKSSSSGSSSHKSSHHRSSGSSGHRSSSDKNNSPVKHSSSSTSSSHKTTSSSSSSHRSPSKGHHHHSSSSTSSHRDRDKDKDRKRDKDEDKDKEKDHHHHHHHRHKSSSSNSSSKKSSHRDRDKDKVSSSTSSSKSKPPAKSAKNHHHSDDDSDSDQGGKGKRVENVYDSDASSSEETNFVESKSRQIVLDFLNEATQSSLTAIKSCSVKKADLIINLRPFPTWRKLYEAISGSKGLSHDLLNHCQELLKRRKKMTGLLRQCQKIISRLERAIEANKEGTTEQPKTLSTELKLADYQLIGLNWLIMMHREGFNGILADEMGLGKTIQVIAFLTHLKEKGLSTVPHLIVVPSSTMDNWDNEMAKWSPQLVVTKYYGSQDERRALRYSFNKGGLEGVDVILTTYNTVASLPEERKMFRTIKIDYVVFDEAHMLKNMTTQRYEYLAKINADRRLLLTGTPLQNNLMELMSLLCFVMPKLFSASIEDLKTLFQKGGKPQKATEMTVAEDGETPATSFEQTQIEQAKLVMKPFVLRRLKKDVLQCLPPKTQTLISVKMGPEQAQRYTDLVEGFKTAREEHNDDTSSMTVMMEMRKMTNHPLLLRHFYTDEKLHEIAQRLATDLEYKKENAQYIFEELAIMSDFQVYQLAQKYTVSSGVTWNMESENLSEKTNV